MQPSKQHYCGTSQNGFASIKRTFGQEIYSLLEGLSIIKGPLAKMVMVQHACACSYFFLAADVIVNVMVRYYHDFLVRWLKGLLCYVQCKYARRPAHSTVLFESAENRKRAA